MNRFLKKTALFLIVVPGAATAQNLVPNSSFESHANCPDLDGAYYFMENSVHEWFSPNAGTADYFNSCSDQLNAYGNLSMSTPVNGYGYQEPHSGEGYIGLYTSQWDNGYSQHEYACIRLSEPLEAYRYYHIEYYVSLADSVWWDKQFPNLQFFDSFGAAVSEESPTTFYPQQYYGAPLYDRPIQVQSPAGVFFDDSLGWQKVEGTFMALGGEEYLTVGNFTSWSETQSNYYLNQNSIIDTYYYLDDVSLVALDSFGIIPPVVVPLETLEIPNVFTPDGDGINDLFTADLPATEGSVSVLNRWGQTVFTSELPFAWDGTSNGAPCSEGVYFYLITAGEETKSGTVHLQF